MQVEKIVIVGGGSSGWMTAALLAKQLPHIDLTVIEPEDIPTVGVGESTLGHINRYMKMIGILDREKEWMPYCAATYKVSIQFTDFTNIGDRFQYPFGQMDYSNDISLQDYAYIKAKHPEFEVPYANFYNPISYLADNNKMTSDSRVIRNFDFNYDTSYHFDAARFGEWLKINICEPEGVTVIRDSVEDINVNDDGIESLVLKKDKSKITADLFIDCTGFKSLLLEQTMGSEFVSFSDVLPNDKAIATKIPYADKKKEIHNVTDCHALSAGWVWDIPLWHRRGTGYVYSSKYISREDAETEFRAHLAKTLDPKRAEEAEFFEIDIRHGKRKRAWVKNVVGIGLSYGFLEPLESTGLFTTHENAIMLVNTLERRSGFVSKVDVDGYNYAADHIIECFKSFIQFHYSLSQREDSQYWKDQIHNTPLYYNDDPTDITLTSPRLYKEYLHAVNVANVSEDLQGLNYIAGGMGYSHVGASETNFRLTKQYADASRINKGMVVSRQTRDYVMRQIVNMQSTYEFLQNNVYFEYISTERKYTPKEYNF
jgi:tryptophan halogenase